MLILVLSFFALTARAQVSIMITDETNQGFILGVDGYIQNTEPVKKLIIEKLDTSAHLLNIHIIGKKDTVRLVRPIHLPDPGNYEYVIMQNFEKRFQLRYRGVVTSFPAGIVSMTRQTVLEWPKPKASPPLASSQTMKPEVKAPKPKPQVQKAPPISKRDSIAVKPVAQKKPTDTAVVSPPQQAAVKNPPLKPPFEVLISEMEKAEFEFVRLNLAKEYTSVHKLSVEQVQHIFKKFQYDNSRLQFLQHAVEKISDPENIKLLEGTLDFELSKEQFKKKYL